MRLEQLNPGAPNADQTFKDIVLAKIAGDYETVNEASLSRAYRHTIDGNFAILTSWRKSNSKEQNLAQYRSLQSDVRSLGHGFFHLLGHWRECQDPTVPYNDCPADQLSDTKEPSIFVVGIGMQDAKRLGGKYQQDAIIYSGPETKGIVHLVFRDGTAMDLGKFSPSRISQAYSRVRTRGKRQPPNSFVFEWTAQSHIEVLIEQGLK